MKQFHPTDYQEELSPSRLGVGLLRWGWEPTPHYTKNILLRLKI
jgi:hypothetical protein